MVLIVNAQERTNPKNQSEELGQVAWYRDYDKAVELAQAEDKAVLILFQEVPGCSTCRNYGHHVLSHPLMVEAIENLFVPLAIFNNKKGKDLAILKKFSEPTWNNPVVRIVDTQGESIVPRVAGNYSQKGLYAAMEAALLSQNQAIPEWMTLLKLEIEAATNPAIQEQAFKMYCFWSGERHLGSVDGVLTTEAGFMGGHEVVKVQYDSEVLSSDELADYAQLHSCTPTPNGYGYRLDKDQQYYLKQSNYRYLPLTKIQRTKINSALGNGSSPLKYLSPKQQAWLCAVEQGEAKKVLRYEQDFERAWGKM